MVLSQYWHRGGPRWAIDGQFVDAPNLSWLLAKHRLGGLDDLKRTGEASGQAIAPIDEDQEVWAAGVTYLRSRVEREAESTAADIYAKVYGAERPELFFKSLGRRAVGPNGQIRIRKDSAWNVPEPELVLVIDSQGEILGYTAGNDVSSRSIEGENPLYLPQAKSYDGSCALGPSIVLTSADELRNLPISLDIKRDGQSVYQGEASTSQMKRTFEDLVAYLRRELTFAGGVLLMTGTGIVPTQEFTLQPKDEVTVKVGELTLTNTVADD